MSAGADGRGGVAIGVDLGTSGLRAVLVDARRAIVATASVPIAPRARRDAGLWGDALGDAIGGLGAQASLGGVTGIAVDGTSGSILPVDEAGRPLAPASLYSERAAADDVARVGAAAPTDSAARGATSPLARLLAWRALPALRHVLHEADWLAGRLCGRIGVTDWNNALKTGFDPVHLCWPDWMARLDLDPALLPAAQAPGSVFGTMTPAIATALGLPHGVRVIAGTTDGCAAFLATGAARPGEGVTSLGSTLTIKLLSDTPIISPDHGVYSHRLGASWVAGGASNSGGAALARYFDPGRLAALSARIDPAVASALDYYPLPAPGERFPVADPTLPPREAPRPPDDVAFLHGLLEGIGRIELRAYRRLAALGAPAVAAVFTVGGGAANPTWTAMRGRILRVPLRAARARDAAVGTAGLVLAPPA